MKSKYYIPIILTLLALLISPRLALADEGNIFNILSGFTCPHILVPICWFSLVIIILIETFIFWLLTKEIFKLQLKFSKILKVNIFANISTALVRTISYPIWLYISFSLPALNLIGFFVLPVFVEWVLYIQLLRKMGLNKLDLLKISFIVNLISILIVLIILLSLVHLGIPVLP